MSLWMVVYLLTFGVYVHVHMCVCVFVYGHVCMCLCVCICTCVCGCVCLCVCMCTCVWAYWLVCMSEYAWVHVGACVCVTSGLKSSIFSSCAPPYVLKSSLSLELVLGTSAPKLASLLYPHLSLPPDWWGYRRSRYQSGFEVDSGDLNSWSAHAGWAISPVP